MKKAYIFLSTLGILGVAAIVIVALVTANRINNQERFSVTGSGTVYAKADIANLTVGLKTEVKKTAAEATKENTTKMNDILKELKGLNIDSKDIKTTDYRLSPVYNWTDQKGQQLAGYEVSQNVNVKIRNLDSIGDVISKTTEKGANQIGNITFTIDDEFELKNEARELAIQKAKEKAEMIAEQTGMKLGDIKGVYENSYVPTVSYDYTNARKESSLGMGAADMAISSPSIEAGQNEIKVEVTLNYEIK